MRIYRFWFVLFFALVNMMAVSQVIPTQGIKSGDTKEKQATSSKAENSSTENPMDERFQTPRGTFKLALELKKKALGGDERALDLALSCLDLSAIPPVSKRSVGKQAYDQLIQTLDRLERVDLETIPENLDDNLWVFRKTSVQLDGESIPVEISLHRTSGGAWLFTPQTVASIQYFYRYVKDRDIVEGVEGVTTFRDRLFKQYPVLSKTILFLSIWQWLGFVLIIFVAAILERIMTSILSRLIEKKVTNQKLKKHLQHSMSFQVPLRILIYSGVLKYGMNWLFLPISLLNVLQQSSIILFTIGMLWMLNMFINIIASYFEGIAAKTENKFDDLLIPLLRKTAKVILFTFGVIFLAQNLWDDVTTLLAGFGIGGLAVALAAKDTLANLFGSLTVLLDRPFQIGDWVQIGSIDGSVEEVGFRSTRIRTFYNSQITVPNNMLTSTAIDNYGARTYRRFKTTLGVEYGTDPEKIEAFCEGIRQLILRMESTRKDYFHVYFNNMGASSLEILLYMFFEVPDWSVELAERHKILINILRLGKRLGVQFAFPTQTLHVFSEKPADAPPLSTDSYQYGLELAQGIHSDPITMKNPRSGVVNGDQFPKDQKG